jgi:hypothetical protein
VSKASETYSTGTYLVPGTIQSEAKQNEQRYALPGFLVVVIRGYGVILGIYLWQVSLGRVVECLRFVPCGTFSASLRFRKITPQRYNINTNTLSFCQSEERLIVSLSTKLVSTSAIKQSQIYTMKFTSLSMLAASMAMPSLINAQTVSFSSCDLLLESHWWQH